MAFTDQYVYFEPDDNYYNTNKNVEDLSYADLVDQVQRNNVFSAEQAQKQMDFQKEMFERSIDFNANQAAIDRAFQQESADRAMAFSSAEAQANRDWQTQMSATAHQREMADLKASGLNPILAANNGASTGAGATATSAQAAGYGASSPGSPSGSKAEADKNGTAAIASLLGKMLDNQVEREKMTVSAENAKEVAAMYTAATQYAAELAMMANEYSADRHYEGTQYSSDTSYAMNMNNPLNVLGHELGNFVGALGNYGQSATTSGYAAQSLADYAANLGKKLAEKISGSESSKDRIERYIDTGGTGTKSGITVKDSSIKTWLKNLFQ